MHDLHIRRHHHRSAAFTEPETEVDVVEDDREVLIKSADRIKVLRSDQQAGGGGCDEFLHAQGVRLSITAGSRRCFPGSRTQRRSPLISITP